MADKFIKWDATKKRKVEQEGLVVSSGAGDAGKIPALDNTGKLDQSLLPVGIGADTWEITASEDLSAGNFVNIYDNAGTSNVRKADASDPNKFASGYVLEAYNSGDTATVYSDKKNDQLSGLTVGQKYWLSDTAPGAITDTPPTASGHIVQQVGVAHSTTELNVEIGEVLELA